MIVRSIAVVLASVILAADARAQFDVPSYLPPRPGDDVGIYLAPKIGDADYAFQGIWRQRGNLNLGLRVGYIDLGTTGAIVVGVDSWGLFAEAGEQFPVDMAWTLGAGAAFNGGTLLELPAGVTIGRTFDVEPVTLQVYGHPRLALLIQPGASDNAVDPDATDDELFVEGLFDVGVDAILNEDLKLRLGITLGSTRASGLTLVNTAAVGFGVAYRWSRGAVVR